MDHVNGNFGPNVHWGNLDPETPLIFADGVDVFENLAKKYIKHDVGYFIMAPSAVGKTYYIVSQKEHHWMDGDELWENTNAHPKGPWWLSPVEELMEIEQRSDCITSQAKKLGFWVIGSMNYWLKPDAIVLPNWRTHKKYIRSRGGNSSESYDGGATEDNFDQVLRHRKWISKWEKQGVPKFKAVKDAAEYLSSQKGVC